METTVDTSSNERAVGTSAALSVQHRREATESREPYAPLRRTVFALQISPVPLTAVQHQCKDDEAPNAGAQDYVEGAVYALCPKAASANGSSVVAASTYYSAFFRT